MESSPSVTFDRNVLLVYSTCSPSSTPWQVHFEVIEDRHYISLKSENHHAIKKMSGITASGGDWLAYLHMMIAARDQAVSQYIDSKFDQRDDPRPKSFHVAYLEANVPKVMQIGMPGAQEPMLMWLQTSPRKGMSINMELTAENMAHVFANIKYYHDKPMEATSPLYDPENDDDDESCPVKTRWNNGKRSFMVNWRDGCGSWRKKWLTPKSPAMQDLAKEELMKFIEANHVPEGITPPSPLNLADKLNRVAVHEGKEPCEAGVDDRAGGGAAGVDVPPSEDMKTASSGTSQPAVASKKGNTEMEQMQNFWKRAKFGHV